MSTTQVNPPGEYPPLPPAMPPAPALVVVPRPPKNPWVALVLSFLFPGIGQIYNGQAAKAVFFFGAFVGTIYVIARGEAMPFALFLPFILFSNFVDAYRSACAINDAWAGGRAPVEHVREGPAWGIALTVIGLLLLFNNLGWLHLAALVRYWPLLLIGAGLVFLRRSLKTNAPAAPPARTEAGDDTSL